MTVRKEHVVFAFALLLMGWLAWGKLSEGELRSSARAGASPGVDDRYAPDVSLALGDGESTASFERDLFSPPRNTAPLPPLPLDAPPLEALDGLAPPTAWGPAPRLLGSFLRAPATARPVPGLFGEEDLADAFEGDDPFDGSGGAADRNVRALEALGYIDAGDDDGADLSPAERAERTDGYKQLYDWIRIADLKFGHITNDDRYDLTQRPNDPLVFVEVDPATGGQRFTGMGAITYERERVSEFGFADTAANRIELGRREFGAALRPPELDDALIFAEECIAHRLDAPRALEIAEEMYRLAEAVAGTDPRPRIGLARCFEIGFRFDEALRLYGDLIEAGHDKEPVVYTRLGDLYARFRMFDRAEEAYGDALRWGRTSWEARWRYGRYLLARGRGEEAVEQLKQAAKFEPPDPERKAERTGIRTDYGAALLNTGRIDESQRWFQRAVASDPTSSRAYAGLVGSALFADDPPADDETLVPTLEEAGFDLLLTTGLAALGEENWDRAKQNLELAADADPFRAFLAWRALSWLAEITGHPEEARAFIDLASQAEPTDAYTLYQRGRLLAAQDDGEGALASFRAALDLELDFAGALVEIGELERQNGHHADAERYYERALSIDAERPRVHARRGFNLLALDAPDEAEASFRSALDRDPDLASAHNGLAWCFYATGDSGEATTQFADLVERRRAAPENDAHKVYAEDQIARISDHEEKEVWTDRFDRRPGTRIGNGWIKEEPCGLEVSLAEGRLEVNGQIATQGRTRVYREIPVSQFVSFGATLEVTTATRARVGVFVAREVRRRGDWEVQAEVSLSRNKEGTVQARQILQGERDAPYEDLFSERWAHDRPMSVRILRQGESGDATLTLFLDGVPVLENVPASRLGRAASALRFGVFVDGEAGRSADVVLDDVELVRRVRN